MMNKIFFIIIITQKFKMINKKIRDRQKKDLETETKSKREIKGLKGHYGVEFKLI